MNKKFIFLLIIISLVALIILPSCKSSSSNNLQESDKIIQLQQDIINKNNEIEELKKELETAKADLLKVQGESSQSTTTTTAIESVETDQETVQDNSKYSRTSPATIGDVITIEKEDWLVGKVKYEIELKEVTIGADAWSIVKEANMFNSEPGEGKEYILAKFRVKVLETEGDKPFEINHAMFNAVSGQGVEYADMISVAGLDPDLSTDLYKEAEHIGWTYFLVDKDDNNPLAVLDRKSESEVWFQLRY